MSNSLPRTMRRKAAMSGSTSTKSNSKLRGLTVPSLRAWLLPWVRVTVLSLGPAICKGLVGWVDAAREDAISSGGEPRVTQHCDRGRVCVGLRAEQLLHDISTPVAALTQPT